MLRRSGKLWRQNIDTWNRMLGSSEGKIKDEQVLIMQKAVIRNFDLRVVHLEALKK